MTTIEQLQKEIGNHAGVDYGFCKCDLCHETKPTFGYSNQESALDLCKTCWQKIIDEFPKE